VVGRGKTTDHLEMNLIWVTTGIWLSPFFAAICS
jgi:hypothetical protein